MKTSAADASSQEGLFIGVTRKRVIYSPIIFCIGLKIFRADGRSHFPVNGVRDRGLRGLRWRKEKCKRTGGGESESWIEGRNVNPEKNRTETSISSSSHFLPLSPSLSLSRYLARMSRVFFFLFQSFSRMDSNRLECMNRERSISAKCLRAATKTFRAEGGFRKLSLASVRDASRIEKKLTLG